MFLRRVFLRLAASSVVTLLLPHNPASAQHLNNPQGIVYTAKDQLVVTSGTNLVFYDVNPSNAAQVTWDHAVSVCPASSAPPCTLTPFAIAVDKFQDFIVGMSNGDVDLYYQDGTQVSVLHNEAGLGFAYMSNKAVFSLQSASAQVFTSSGKLLRTYTEDSQKRPFEGGATIANGTAVYYAYDDTKTGGSLVETFSAASLYAGTPEEREHFVNASSPHPVGIAIDAAQHEYVVGNNSLSAFTHPGVLVFTVTGLDQPGGVAVNPAGKAPSKGASPYYVYVTESAANDIKVFDSKGHLAATVQ